MNDLNQSWDVAVIGGGTAGVIAAIQAARAGARTLLVEKTGLLGGTITTAAVDFPGLFHAWGRQVIAGIGWDLVVRCVEECGLKLPPVGADQTGRNHPAQQVRIHRVIYAALCDEAVLGAGADLLLHTMIAGATQQGDGWRLTLCTKTGLREVDARVLIDCTGDANAALAAGCVMAVPPECQPGSLVCRVSGYDPKALDYAALERAYMEAVAAGRLTITDSGWDTSRPSIRAWLAGGGDSLNHIGGINARDSEGRTRLEVEARKAQYRLYRFLRAQPGLQNIRFDFQAPECGVRETATIVGRKTITLEDYYGGRLWDDAVCYSFYPIDLHKFDGTGLDLRPLPEGTVATIPRGAMLPVGRRNLIVAGRCIASDRLANSALRVQATAMATGQAAGALAALAAASRTEAEEVPFEDLRALLRRHGAIVPPDRS